MEDFCLGQKPSQNRKTEHFLTEEKTSTSNLTCWDKKRNQQEYLKQESLVKYWYQGVLSLRLDTGQSYGF